MASGWDMYVRSLWGWHPWWTCRWSRWLMWYILTSSLLFDNVENSKNKQSKVTPCNLVSSTSSTAFITRFSWGLEHHMDCVFVSFRGWMGKTKASKYLWTGMVAGARCTGFWQQVQWCWGFSRSIISSVYQEGSTTQRTSNQLDITVGSIGVNTGQHPCGTLLTPCRVHVPTTWGCSEGKKGCNSILGRCS